MKKFLLFATLIVATICANARFTINKAGRIAIGDGEIADLPYSASFDSTVVNPGIIIGLSSDPMIPSGIEPSIGNKWDDLSNYDPSIYLYLFGDSLGRGARIMFGDYGNNSTPKVLVGELNGINTDKLQLHGNKGIYLTAEAGSNDTVAFFDSSKDNDYFHFNKEIKAPGIVLPSDSRFKTDIRDLDTLCNGLTNLNAVSFRLKTDDNAANTNAASAPSVASVSATDNGNERTHYGFIAQEVKAVFPELVHTDSAGYMYVDYIGMIPLLVDALNSLNAKTDSLQSVIDELKNPETQVRKSSAYGNASEPSAVTDIPETVLYQNIPNPFCAETEIRCLLPADTRNADIYVYDMQGMQKKKYSLQGRGQTSIVIRGSELAPGMYIYSLIADGKEIDSKRMILTD